MMEAGECHSSRGLMRRLSAVRIKVWLPFPLEYETYKFIIGEIHFWQLHTKSYVVSLPSKENINEMQDPRDKVMSVWSLGLQMPLLMYYTYKAGRMNIWGWQSAHASPALCNPATEAPKQVSRYVHTQSAK